MKKTTQKSLSKRLAHYGALTLAIAGVADASGQIIYTDISPDSNGGVNADYSLDLNNDGTVDFGIKQLQINYYSVAYFNRLSLFPTNAANEGLTSNAAGLYAYPFALNSGDIISNGQETWANNGYSAGFQMLNWALSYSGSVVVTNGNFVDVANKFIGLRFDISGETHYGWVRLDVSEDAQSWVVKDYAYNSVAGEPINAGQITLGLGVNELTKIKIVALNKSIGLYNLPENTSYKLFSTSGQSVLTGTTNRDTYVIEANSLANGVYVLELNDGNTNGVIRKKIVL